MNHQLLFGGERPLHRQPLNEGPELNFGNFPQKTINMANMRDPSDSRDPEDKKVKYKDNFSETPPSKLKTPASCVADFCLIPIGTPTASVSNEVADVQRLMQTCGLDYSMHSAGTTVGS